MMRAGYEIRDLRAAATGHDRRGDARIAAFKHSMTRRINAKRRGHLKIRRRLCLVRGHLAATCQPFKEMQQICNLRVLSCAAPMR